jgi:predicted MFS family arabinose efflux permease
LINVPLSLTTALLAARYVDKDSDDITGGLDWLGAALVTTALGLVTWALTEGSGRAWSFSAFAVLGAASIFMLLFLVVEHQLGDRAMMPLSLFGSRNFVGLTLLTFLLYGALGGMFVLVPYVLIQAAGYTATQAGAALLPLPLVIVLASPAAGGLAAKVGSRWLLITGPAIVATGLLLMLRITETTSYWVGVLPAMIAIALGLACAVAPLTTAVLMTVDSTHTGTASGLSSAVARTGGLVVTALIGPVLASSGPALLPAFDIAATMGAVICLVAAASVGILITPAANTLRSTQL